MGAPLGNQNAAKGRRWAESIDRALERRAKAKGLLAAQEALDDLAEQFLQVVEAGDIAAFKELADRIDGKAPQALTGPDGGAFQAVFTWLNKSS